MKFPHHTLLVLVALVVACGSSIDKKGGGDSPGGNNGSENNGTVNNGTVNNGSENNGTVNNGGTNNEASCGNGVLDPGELCDPAVAEGPGACPASCQAPACSTAVIVGEAASCTAQCLTEPLACAHGDGCCPAGCDAAMDSDCTNSCGDGVTEGPELCDGNCPTSCGDPDACTTDEMVGSVAQCNVECRFSPITTCTSGDGCCPAGCTDATDDDCEPGAVCGDSVVDDGESCDGNCPTSCDDGNACTTDTKTGSASSCNVQCGHTQKTACQSGDGCCPAGCTNETDNDCACVPKTCAQLGAECGAVDNGCNQTIQCTNTCTRFDVCTQNKCVEQSQVGEPCADYPDCGTSPNAACALPPEWPDGYCSIVCNNDSCPTGSHCADFDGTNELCMLDCTTDADCRAGYECRDFDGRGVKECSPPPVDTVRGGDACQSDAECPQGYTCETSVSDGNGGTKTLPGGACTATCLAIFLQCPTTDTACGSEGWCMSTCASNADCRAGYFCNLSLNGGYCWPS